MIFRRRPPVQDIPEAIPGFYVLGDDTRVPTEARLMGTSADGLLRYVMTVPADDWPEVVGAGLDLLPGKSALEVCCGE